jgi:hypothetical protein
MKTMQLLKLKVVNVKAVIVTFYHLLIQENSNFKVIVIDVLRMI